MQHSLDDFEIVAGTYEDFVVGHQIYSQTNKSKSLKSTEKKSKTNNGSTDPTASRKFLLDQSFAVRAHAGSVRLVASNQDGSLLISAGADETINMFNMKRRNISCTVEGKVNCAKFVGDSYLIYGSDDNNIYIYKCRNGTASLAKTLKGHKGPVINLDTHPSGKLMLSLSKDGTMRTWNLIKGRSCYVTQIKSEAHLVRWSTGGDEFLVATDSNIYLYNLSGKILQTIKLNKKINAIEFITKDSFVVASDCGALKVFCINKILMSDDTTEVRCELEHEFAAHKSRIKSIQCLSARESARPHDRQRKRSRSEVDETCLDDTIFFATASSDGSVKLWSLEADCRGKSPKSYEVNELAQTDLGTRLTCMTMVRKQTVS